MDAKSIAEFLRSRFGWRIGPHTARYILDQLASPAQEPFPVIAADARTGRPLRPLVDPRQIVVNQPGR